MARRQLLWFGRAHRHREGRAVGPALLVLAFVATAMIGLRAEDRLMPQLVSFSPAAGARVVGAVTLSAVLDLSRGDVTDPSSIRMSLDGADVTRHCTTVATRDVPPSRVEVACPLGTLDTRLHAAELRLGPAGPGGYAHRWHFAAIAE
jgi:hypothetical protein